jgi:sarcosine oxidase
MIGVWEPRAGMLNPEGAITAALDVARAKGAEVHTNEALIGWEATPSGVAVTTSAGTYHGRRLILSVGAWAGSLLAELQLPLVVQRNVLYWFDPLIAGTPSGPDAFPIFLSEYAPGKSWYGFPDTGDGMKFALHHSGGATHPDVIRRSVDPEEVAQIRRIIRRYLPDADGALRDSAVCMYTNTPDEHFIIDRHPASAAVIVASPCSGHGFKFASVIGEILADLAQDITPSVDLSAFTLARFAR